MTLGLLAGAAERLVEPRCVLCGLSKASARNAGDLGSIPQSGRSPREGNGNPLQYSCLENSMDGDGGCKGHSKQRPAELRHGHVKGCGK